MKAKFTVIAIVFTLLMGCFCPIASAGYFKNPDFKWGGHKGWVPNLSFNPDGTLLASAGVEDKNVILRDARTGEEQKRFHCQSVPTSISWNADGTLLAIGLGNGNIVLYDVVNGEVTHELKAHAMSVTAVAFSPNKSPEEINKLLSSSKDRHIKMWDVRTGSEILNSREGTEASHLAFNPNGTQFVAVSKSGSNNEGDANKPHGTLTLWEANGNRIKTIHDSEYNFINAVTFSPDGLKIGAASGNYAKVWDVETGGKLHTYILGDYSANSVSFSPDGTRIAAGAMNVTLKIWKLDDAKGAAEHTFWGGSDSYGVDAVSFNPADGNQLVCGGEEGTIKVWDLSKADQH